VLALGAVALGSPGLPIVTSTPVHADQITNIDVVRQQIKNYYGDSAGTGIFAADSSYVTEAAKVAADGNSWISARANAPAKGTKKAILLDVDDTTLATYNYEVFSNWKYDPTTNANYVNGELFPAVPGMVAMVEHAKALGYAVIYLTGRPDSQEGHTLGNLIKYYPAPSSVPEATEGGGGDGIFTKPALFLDPPTNSVPNPAYPDYLDWCSGTPQPTTSCNTDEYKSATRQYIESLGYEIVANFGDQYSDFSGGFEDKTFKLPNPSYFLP